MFVTFEGVDRSGKTTQANLLFETLRARGDQLVHLIREPGGTAISERIRGILLDRSHSELSELTELFLFSASRAQLVQQVIAPALRRGELVICDRYYDSTTAYQGYGRGVNLDAIRRINSLAVNHTVPDLTILVDVSPEEIDHRRKSASGPVDRMELSGRGFYERVRAGYLALAREEPERFVVINGMRPVDEIAAEVQGTVTSRLAQRSKELKS